MMNLSGLMAVALIALLVMSTVSSLRRDFDEDLRNEQESGNDQVEELRTIAKPRQCFGPFYAVTKVGCPWKKKQMWTFDEKRNKCVITTVDGCNEHGGNIFKSKNECIRACAPK